MILHLLTKLLHPASILALTVISFVFWWFLPKKEKQRPWPSAWKQGRKAPMRVVDLDEHEREIS